MSLIKQHISALTVKLYINCYIKFDATVYKQTDLHSAVVANKHSTFLMSLLGLVHE